MAITETQSFAVEIRDAMFNNGGGITLELKQIAS
jgi:hypothetical protein